MAENYSIYVGGKPLMNYVTALVMQFTAKYSGKVAVKSRGKFISRAVDVVEVARNKFLKDKIIVESISIGSEDFTNEAGKPVKVSTIEIVLAKK
ncbi:MAG: DNA-binding protein Alba [Nanoarchaeota archaeon]